VPSFGLGISVVLDFEPGKPTVLVNTELALGNNPFEVATAYLLEELLACALDNAALHYPFAIAQPKERGEPVLLEVRQPCSVGQVSDSTKRY